MKRVLLMILVIFLFSAVLTASGKKFTVTIYGNYLTIADEDFEAQYGGKQFFPEGKVTFSVFGNVYLWGSYGFFPAKFNWTEWSNKGVIEADIAGERTVDKRIISGGVGFFAGFIRRNEFSIKAEAGICSITDAIESTTNSIPTQQFIGTEKIKQSGTGIRGRLGVTYGVYKSLFSELSLSYLYAANKVDDERINLGGIQLSIGIGIKF